jgi:uncharacterized protein YwgA
MNTGDTISTIAWVCVLLFFGYGAVQSSRNQKFHKELKLKSQAEEQLRKEAESKINKNLVTHALDPKLDTEAAIMILKTQFHWSEITSTLDLHSHHLSILEEISYSSKITLPNMHLSHYGADEKRVIKKAKEMATPIDYEYGIEGIFQEPTTDHLLDLENQGLIKTQSVEGTRGRIFDVCFTEQGKKFFSLHLKFSDRNKDLSKVTNHIAAEQRTAVARLIYAFIRV